LISFFFLNNHREYIEKAIKSIVKVKYKNMTKEKRKKKRLRKKRKIKLIYYSKQQRDYLRFLITPQFDAIKRS
jgi:hypothetical protein